MLTTSLFPIQSHSSPCLHSAHPISLRQSALLGPTVCLPSVTSLYKHITVHTNTSLSRNRLLSHLLCTSALDPAKLPSILRASRAALFPGNMPAGPSSLVPPASEAEYRRLRRRCAQAVYRAIAPGPGLVRSAVKTFFLGGFGFGSRSQQNNDQRKSIRQYQPGRKAQGKGNDNRNKPRGRATKGEGSAFASSSSSSSAGVGEVGLGPAAWLKNGGPEKDRDRDKAKGRDDKKGKNIGSSPWPSTSSSPFPAKDQHQQHQQQRSASGPVGPAAVSSALPLASSPSSTITPVPSASNVAVDANASSSLLPSSAVSASAGTNTSLCASRENNGADDDRRDGKRRLIHKPASHSQAYYYYDINRWNDCGEDEDHYDYYDIDSDEEWDEDERAVLREIDRSVLDVFSDAYCNKHLIYGIVELVLVRLMPELAERGVGELWAERIPDVVHPVQL